jgi:hypothetical protein
MLAVAQFEKDELAQHDIHEQRGRFYCGVDVRRTRVLLESYLKNKR